MSSGHVYGTDSSSMYLFLTGHLGEQELDTGLAIEFPGEASALSYNGWVFVADGEQPVITRYSVTDDCSLTEEGRVSFAGYGFELIYLDDWGVVFASPSKAYVFDYVSGDHVIWNPETMEIEGVLDAPEEVQDHYDDEDYHIDVGAAHVRGNLMFRVYGWNRRPEHYETVQEQYLAVYDTDTDELVALHEETRCPGLNYRVEPDEDGNLIFSNWVYNVAETLLYEGPESCSLRIENGESDFDGGWQLIFSDYTDGREAAAFSYLGDGFGFINVFHDDRFGSYDEGTDPFDMTFSPNWRLWRFEIGDEESGEPIEGLDFTPGGYSVAKTDGRTFVMLPVDSDYSATDVYEILEDGTADYRFQILGWAYQLSKVK